MLKAVSDSEGERDLGSLATLGLRLVFGAVLIYGTQDNILSWERMIEFSDFLEARGFPVPLASAVVSVYAQAICGLLVIVGALTRYAAAVMVFNFVVAILMVHLETPFSANIAPISMLTFAGFLAVNGPGRHSLDHRLANRPVQNEPRQSK